MRVRKKDRENYISKVISFLNEKGKAVISLGGNDFELSTIHGELIVFDPASWNEHGSSCLSLMAKFKEVANTLPCEANQYSGKWNTHLSCDVGEGLKVANDSIERFKRILV